MSHSLAPIALFVYNRLSNLKKTVNSLKKNEFSSSSILYIFSDAWKSQLDKYNVLTVRKYIKSIKGFKKIHVVHRKKNFGLSKNIITGVSFILKKYNSIIVIEDDLILGKFFLRFINEGLKIYKNVNNVASIHGYFYPVSNNSKLKNTFFIKGADCWGWGTWRRAWNKFNIDGEELLKIIKSKKLKNKFNFNNSYNYYKMLEDQISKKNDSWAIRWYASAFTNEMYTLYPKQSLVQNIGVDKGINSKYDFLNLKEQFLSDNKISIKKQMVKESPLARKEIEIFFKKKRFFRFKENIKKFFYV